MCIRLETREKAWQSLALSPVSKPHTHITYMLRQCTSIVYVFLWHIYMKLKLRRPIFKFILVSYVYETETRT
jgi:hypothetical protein